jgi:hypothetical protein
VQQEQWLYSGAPNRAMLGVVIVVTLGSATGEGYPLYAAPISIPTPSTIAPPSTIWKTACRNGVSM